MENRIQSQTPEYFRITDRDFYKILDITGVKEMELTSLAPNSVVLEVGSGTNQSFSRKLKELRPDINCISLDPTLALDPKDFNTSVTDWDKDIPTAIYYNKDKEDSELEHRFSSYVREKRLEEANKTGNVVAGLAPDLPIKSNSVDFIIDSWAAGYYLEKNTENFDRYISDISRILKPGGKARLYPVFDKATFDLDFNNFRSKFPKLQIKLVEGSVFIGLSILKLFDEDLIS